MTSVSPLRAVEPDAQYEAALVLAVPPAVGDLVRELRGRLRLPAPPEHQLVPHVTVLFLGHAGGAWLRRTTPVLEALKSSRVTATLCGLGSFVEQGRVRNLHLRLGRTRGLRDLHSRAINASSELGWIPSTPYIHERYLPHISVYDRIDIEADVVSALGILVPRSAMELGELYVIGKVLRP